MVDLAAHNAKVSLNNKFELISRDESRTIKAIEELGTQMGIQTPIRIEAFDNSLYLYMLHIFTIERIRKWLKFLNINV